MNDASMDLALDVGNTRTKLALFRGEQVVRSGHLPNGDRDALSAFLADDMPAQCVIGSVAETDDAFLSHLRSIASLLVVTGETPAPLRSQYTTPLTLGADRLATAVAAARHFPGRPVIAIDLG